MRGHARSDLAVADSIVVGAGPAGLAAALALASDGRAEVTIAAPRATEAAASHLDTRTAALLPSSIRLLENLGAWQDCRCDSAPLMGIRIIDDEGGLLRAPEVLFRAEDVDLPNFGTHVALPTLSRALTAAVGRSPRIHWRATPGVTVVAPGADTVQLTLSGGDTLICRLVIGADGVNSVAREGARIAKRSWTYPQTAIAGTVTHAREQGGITTEFHRRAGPLTVVPLGRDRASFIWVEQPGEAMRLANLPDDDFLDALSFRLKGVLGALRTTGPRATFPLSGLRAERMGFARVALVGESAHVIPPIGAQGLNLSLRDAATLADSVGAARAAGEDIGAPRTLQSYDAARRADVDTRALVVDLLNRSLLNNVLPVASARGFALHLLANFPALRRLAIAGGLNGLGSLPRLMQDLTSREDATLRAGERDLSSP